MADEAGPRMKPHLMYRDRDFDPDQELPWNQEDLTQDLELGNLLKVMAGDDEFLFDVIQPAILNALANDIDTILYRQQILRDYLNNQAVVTDIYNLTIQVIETTRREWWFSSSRYPSSVLHGSVDLLQAFSDALVTLRRIAEERSGSFESDGFKTLFAMLRRELNDEYLASVKDHLAQLRFRQGVLVSAELGSVNESTNYVLRRPNGNPKNWLQRLLTKGPPEFTYDLPERDEAGAQILSDMRSRAISRVAIAVAESAEHVLNFFRTLRTELAFYIGCGNLHAQLSQKGEPVCFPIPAAIGDRRRECNGVYDVSLALRTEERVVGNTISANHKDLIIITGANQGGKSSFLRSLGQAQFMMQAGMFVAAEAFSAEVCPALFTHYKRGEDSSMKSGKLDEELARMSAIVDHVTPNSLLLCNESFAATNEREGSEIAQQIVTALLEKNIKIAYVTHLYTFARAFSDRRDNGTMFLRAERKADGTRTFRLIEGEPLETSYGEDLYRRVFDNEPDIAGMEQSLPAVS